MYKVNLGYMRPCPKTTEDIKDLKPFSQSHCSDYHWNASWFENPSHGLHMRPGPDHFGGRLEIWWAAGTIYNNPIKDPIPGLGDSEDRMEDHRHTVKWKEGNLDIVSQGVY